MKKYMAAEGIELLKEFNISHIETTINYRCDRIICADCNTVSDAENPCSCKREDKKKRVYHSMETGENILVKDSGRLFIREEDGAKILFYYELIGSIIKETGAIKFFKRPIEFMSVKDNSFTFTMTYGVNEIAISDVLNILEANNVQCDRLMKILKLCKVCNYHNWASLNKYVSMIDVRGHKLFEDEKFVESHTALIRHVINRSYGNGKIDSVNGICEYFEIPECLVDYTKDPYFSKIDGYSDIRLLDSHPIEIQGCFAYYIGSGKFTRRTIKTYLDTFDVSFWDSRNKINYFLTYVKKNLWMGDAVFGKAVQTFKYVEEKKFPTNEDTINSKFCFGMKNVDMFAERFGTAEADEFHQIRESQGIVPALKQLLVWTNKNEGV